MPCAATLRNGRRRTAILSAVFALACLQLTTTAGASSSSDSEYFVPADYVFQQANLYFTTVFPNQPDLLADASSEAFLRNKFLEIWAKLPPLMGITDPGKTDILDVSLAAATDSPQILLRFRCASWADATLVQDILENHAEFVQQHFERVIGPVKFNAFQIGELTGQVESKYEQWL